MAFNLGQLYVPNFSSADNITSPWSERIKTALNTSGSIQGLIKGQKDIEGKGYANKIAQAKSQYAQPMAAAELEEAQAKPKLTLAQATYQTALAAGVPSEIALRYAQATHAREEAEKLAKLMPYVSKREEAEIGKENAMSKYYSQGGGTGSTGSKDQWMYQDSIKNDNPNLNDQQSREAANIVAGGGNQLSDGTQINVSPLTKMALDRALKATTTAKLITAGVQANQAEAELTAGSKYIAPIIDKIGTTYAGKSINQLMDSLSNNPKDQDELGEMIGARSLQYAFAQLRNRIDMGEAGINATKELMENSGQLVDQTAPRITARARKKAMEFISEGAQKMLNARNSTGFGASAASGTFSKKTYSKEDLEHTAQKYNMTIDQVKQKLGVE